MTTVFSILVLVASVILILAVAISEPAENDMSAILGGNSDSFWENNKGNSKEAKLNKLIICASIVFLVSLILLLKF